MCLPGTTSAVEDAPAAEVSVRAAELAAAEPSARAAVVEDLSVGARKPIASSRDVLWSVVALRPIHVYIDHLERMYHCGEHGIKRALEVASDQPIHYTDKQ